MCIECSPENHHKREFLLILSKLRLTSYEALHEIQQFSDPGTEDLNPTSFWNLWYPHGK